MKKLKNNTSGFSVIEGVLILFIVGIVGFAGWYVWHAKNNTNKTLDDTARGVANTQKPSQKNETTNNSQTYGIITGDTSYPSSRLPSDEEVCAASVSDLTKVYCDKVGARQPENDCPPIGATDCTPSQPITSYSLKVPAGNYYVYSTAESRNPGYKAYYNEFAKCGNSVNCPEEGHDKKIIVTVAANQTVTKIDPTDWYNY